MSGVTTNLQKKTLGDGDSCLGESRGILDVDVENVDVEIGLGRTKFRNKFLGLPPKKSVFSKSRSLWWNQTVAEIPVVLEDHGKISGGVPSSLAWGRGSTSPYRSYSARPLQSWVGRSKGRVLKSRSIFRQIIARSRVLFCPAHYR